MPKTAEDGVANGGMGSAFCKKSCFTLKSCRLTSAPWRMMMMIIASGPYFQVGDVLL